MRDVRTRFWVEIVLASLSFFLFVLTLITREWIELVFRVDPDNGSGALEWLIVALTFLAFAVFAILARAEWRRDTAPAGAAS